MPRLSHHPAARRAAIGLDVLIGIGAMFGMLYALGGAEGVDPEWLAGCPSMTTWCPG